MSSRTDIWPSRSYYIKPITYRVDLPYLPLGLNLASVSMVENDGSRVFEGTVMLFVAAAVAALGLIGFPTAASALATPWSPPALQPVCGYLLRSTVYCGGGNSRMIVGVSC